MRSMNLYLLTRVPSGDDFSRLAGELTGDTHYKEYSRHEAESLRALVSELIPELRSGENNGSNWISYLDGFYFSYTIAHISKEFDLLKISEDGQCVLNIELKSESIEESRISKQLSQNRYYLSHISGTIYSYTYVMENHTLYYLNDKGHMRISSMEELADVMRKPVFSGFVEKDLDLYFRAADYLISPAALPEKFLQGGYFLTNQQAEFRRKILETFSAEAEEKTAPVVTVAGSAGTGKTLLLFDLAMALSKKKKVVILHGGKLQKGHEVIDSRLKNVAIRNVDEFDSEELPDYIFVDEANRVSEDTMDRIIRYIRAKRVPCIMAYDPHTLVDRRDRAMKTENRIEDLSTLYLEFTGNIRINRPLFSFLHVLFHQKEKAPEADYSCIDVLFAKDADEASEILSYYEEKGYQKIAFPGADSAISGGLSEEDIVGMEYEYVSVVMDDRFFYDDDKSLCCLGTGAGEALNLLYEGISRTREKLCLLVLGDEDLFSGILEIRGQ